MATPVKPVFLSYSTRTGGELALALEAALGSELAYRDESNLEHGKHFPAQLFEALVEARVVVCLLDGAYNESWFCRTELEIATNGGQWDHVVVALPEGSKDRALQLLPAGVRSIQWPRWSEPEAIVGLVKERLAQPALPHVSARLSPSELETLRGWVNEEARMMPRRTFGDGVLTANLRVHPQGRFFGRAELLIGVHQRLLPSAGPGECAIVAPGGGGKTRLAREYVWRYGPTHYPGGVIWIDAATPGTEEPQFYAVLAQLVPDLPDFASLKRSGVDIKQRLREKLEERRELGPVLWVIDNVPEPAPDERPRPLSDWHPELPGQVSVLATSRLRQFPRAINLELGTLERADASMMLREGLPEQSLSTGDADTIAAAVGDWPLALELLNAGFAEEALTPAEFIAHHEQHGVTRVLDDAMEIIAHQVPIGALRGVSETLLLSYERLPPKAQTLARTLGHCAPMESLPLVLLDELGEIAPEEARVALRSRSLVNESTDESFGYLHPIVADFLRAQDSDHRGIADLGRVLLRLVPDGSEGVPARWPMINTLVPQLVTVVEASSLPEPLAQALAANVVMHLISQGRNAESLALSARLAARWSEPESATPELYRFRLVRGSALRHAGHGTDAEAVLQALYADGCRFFGPDHPTTLKTMRQLGFALHDLGRDAECLALERESLRLHEQRLGRDSIETVTARMNYGSTCYYAGELSTARTLLEEAVEASERMFGLEHQLTRNAAISLAITLSDQGDLSGARALEARNLEVQERALGPEHPSTLTARMNYAYSLYLNGQLVESRDLIEPVLPIIERLFGPAHSRLASAQVVAALTQIEMGDLNGAKRNLEAAIATRIAGHGPNGRNTLFAQVCLALTLLLQREPDAAQELAEATLSMLQEHVPAASNAMLDSAEMIIAIRLACGHPGAAGELAERTLASYVETRSAIHFGALRVQYHLARCLRVLGDAPAARALLESTLAAQRAQFAVTHPSRNRTASALYQLLADAADAGASDLFNTELAWLLEPNVETPALAQREIREALLALGASRIG